MASELIHNIEALIFVAEQPVQADFLLNILRQEAEERQTDLPQQEELEEALAALLQKYEAPHYPFEIRKVAGGYQFFTKQRFHPFVRRAMIQKNQKRLTRTALETLSIIAYKQPITKAEMEFIRGVNCDYAVQKLLDKQLVSITGRSEAAGRPLLYGTSPFFMEYFGLADMSDLPKLKEFEVLAEEQMEDFRQKQTASDPTSQLTPTNGRQETSEERT